MIRINLLPSPEKKPRIVYDLYLFVFLLVITSLILGGLFYLTQKRIWDLERQISEKKSQIQSMEPIHKEYMAMEREKKEIEQRLKVVESIKKGRALPARILFDLSSLVKETVWLKTLKKAEGKLTIEGCAMENESIADFIEQLLKLPYVKNAELMKIEEIVEEGLPVKKFLIVGEVLL